MTTPQDFGHELKSFELAGYGEVDYVQWLNPFAYSLIVTKPKLDFFKKFIKEGDFAIDIGANIGDTGLPMGLAAGANGTVMALEPNPHLYKILEINSGLNKDKLNLIPLPYAATTEDGEFYYNSSEATFNNGGISKVRSKFHGNFELKEKIKGINLENLLRDKYSSLLNSLSFIKVDTEGYDKDILISLKGVIEEFRPSVMFEVFKKLNKEDRSELYNLFGENGYKLFKFDDFDVNAPVTQLEHDDMSNWQHFDVYATYTKGQTT